MRPAVLALFVLAVGLLTGGRAGAADEVRKGPYLQRLSSSSVDVEIELATAASLQVDVAPDAPAEAPPAAAKTDATFVSPVNTFASPAAVFHQVHVTGLAPATRYHYAVHVGRALVQGSLVTAPEGTSHAPFTFVLYGDNRTDGPAHERVARAIAGESFDFLVNSGDFVIRGVDEEAWQTFFDIEEPLLRDHALFACVGNHELASDREAEHFERYFGPREKALAPTPTPIYGSFRWGRARFFLLNAFTDWGSGPERSWLDGALASADHEPGVDLRVAVLHQGPYSAGPHGGSRALTDAHIDELFVAHHVDLVLSGHDHIYERGEAKGLKYVVSGGGGAPLYRDLTPLPSTRKVEATYNYVLATVTDDGVAILAKRPDGSIVDQCRFARGGSWQCDAPPPAAKAGNAPESAPLPSKAARCGCDVVGSSRGAGEAAFGWTAFALLSAGRFRRRRPRARSATSSPSRR